MAKRQTSLPNGGNSEKGLLGEMFITSYDNEELRIDNLKLSDYRRMKDNDGQVQMLLNAIYNTIISAGIDVQDDPEFTKQAKEEFKQQQLTKKVEQKEANQEQFLADDILEKKEEGDEDKIEDTAELTSPTESEEKLFIEKMINDAPWRGGMERDFELVNRTNLRAIEEGFILNEIVYKVGEDGKLRVSKLAPRISNDINQLQVKVITDEHGNFYGFRQTSSLGSNNVDVRVVNDTEILKVINVVFGAEYGSNYGRSALKPIWYHYDKAHKAMYLNHVGHELGSIKFRHVKKLGLGISDEEEAAMENMVNKIGHNNWISYDSNRWELLFEDVSDADVMRVGKEMIDYHTSQMAKAWLMQFIELGQNTSGGTGTRNLGADQIAFFKNGIQSIASNLIEKIWNRIIADVIKINFGSDIYPTVKVRPIADERVSLLYEAFIELVKKGKVTDSIQTELLKQTSLNLGLDVDVDAIGDEVNQMALDAKNMQILQATKMAQDPNGEKNAKGKKPGDDKSTTTETIPSKQTSLADDIEAAVHIEHGPEVMQPSIARPLYNNEKKVKLVDINRRLKDAQTRAIDVMKAKLDLQGEEIINNYIQALRQGRSAIKKINIELQEGQNDYSEELMALAFELMEYGKITAANELAAAAGVSSKQELQELRDSVESIVEEQEATLKFRLTNVANQALRGNIPENQARLLLEKEYDHYWTTKLFPTLAYLVPFTFSFGRSISFKRNKEKIFAYRYTAILDGRTTEYCKDLDGKVFQETDPDYAILTPPNHWGCRSIWTTITHDEAREDNIQVDGKPTGIPIYSSISTFRDTRYEDTNDMSELNDYTESRLKTILEFIRENDTK